MAVVSLDEEQQRAAAAPEQRVRVLAGAGTGKTTTLVARARYLLRQGVHPRALCIVTFTRRAAEELARRVGPQGTGVLIGTIHALGLRILRFEKLGRPVADNRRQKQLILQAMREHNERQPLAKVSALLHRAKNFGRDYPTSLQAIGTRYDQLLRENSLWDFDDLILEPRRLLTGDDLAAGRWRDRYSHLLVDEAQDTSTVQWELLECLTTPATHTYTVGDIGQSIYSWRGAESQGLLTRFTEGAVTYTIGKNYRSVRPILTVANRVLVGKPGAVVLESARPETTAQGVFGVYGTTTVQAISAALEGLKTGEYRPTDVAILGRTHAILGEAELACVASQVPYFLVGGLSFYERAEVLDVLAHLDYAADVNRPAALDRFYNRPSRYLGAAWHAAVMAQGGWARWDAEGPSGFRWPHAYMGTRAQDLWGVCQGLRAYGSETLAREVIDYVIDRVGYGAWVRQDGIADAEASEDNDVLDNLSVLRETAQARTVREFIAFVDACRHRPQRVSGAGGVTLSTIHRAKGLEWPVVIVAGCLEGTFPHVRGDAEGEERRLYYVAVTRPMEQLVLAISDPPSRYARESIDVLGLVVPGLTETWDGANGGEPDADASGAAGDADCGAAGEGTGDGAGGADGGADRGIGPDGTGAGPGSPADGE